MKPRTRKILNFLFIAATILMVVIIAFGNNELINVWDLVFTLNPWWLIAAAGCWFGYLFFDATGYHYFLRKQGYPVTLRYSLFISLIGFYYGNITPGASGGQPMQIYYMKKRDIPIAIGTSAISMKFICNQFITVLVASILWAVNIDFVNTQLAGVRWMIIIGWIVNFAAVPLVLLVALHRTLVQSLANFLIRIGAKLRLVKDPEATKLHLSATLDSYHASIIRLGRHPKQIVYQLFLSFLSVMGLMTVVICVYHAFGLSGVPWYHLLTVAFLLFLSASYTPLPGASGVQEGGFLVFYRGLFTSGTIRLALLVWRFMTYYLFLITGAIMTVFIGARLNRKKSTP